METGHKLNKNATNKSGVRSDYLYGNILDQKRYIFALKYVHNKTVLDCACGVGWGSFLMANAGAKGVYGIDISESAIRSSRKYFNHENITYKKCDPYDLSQDYKFDLITSFETIEHVENPLRFLKSLRQLSQKNTILLLSTPNAYCFKYKDHKPYNPYHLNEFSKDELDKMFFESDWVVQKYLGQFPISKKSHMINKYRKFIRQYWKYNKLIKTYKLPAKLILKLLIKSKFLDLSDPAHLSDCVPCQILVDKEPAYHYYVLIAE